MTRQERRTLFKEVAVQLISTRPMGVVKGTAGGDIVCPDFLKDVSLITEGILAEADRFETMSAESVSLSRSVRVEYDKRQKEYASGPRVTAQNWREDFSKAAQSVINDNTELLQELAKSEKRDAAQNKATARRRRRTQNV